ncbi:MAG: hypothetical protein ABJB47_00840 [Actinomycetota bacterium]
MADPGTGGDDRVLPLTRGVSLAIIPFLVVAFAVLYPWPHDTGRLFAWDIKPTITPMILGSVYLGGAYFFLRAVMAKQWHTVKGGFIPVATFATLMGVATIAHWDRFTHSHVAFWLWAGLYFTTPFLIAWVWWANRGHDAPGISDGDVLLPAATARVIAVLGGLSVLTGMFLFLLPGRAVAVWPWALTPLTSRVLGAIFFLGVAGLGAVADRRWSSARILLQVAALMLTLIVIAGVRAAGELSPSNAMTWLISCGFAGVLAAIAALYLRMRAQLSRPAQAAGRDS